MTAKQSSEQDPAPRPDWWAELLARVRGLFDWIERRLSTAFFRCRGRWRHLSPFMRRFLFGLLLGLAIEVLLHQLHDQLTLVRELEDRAIDGLMRVGWSEGSNKTATPVVLLDIDEKTYRQWNEPLHIPRGELLKLIEFGVQGGAALIIVDVDLSQPGHDPTADQKLHQYLADYGTTGKEPPPLLLLARAMRPALADDKCQYPYTERRSFLDPFVARSPLIRWGSTLFELDPNRVLRRWRLWEVTCDAENRPTVVPSLQLLAAVALQCPTSLDRVTDELRKKLLPAADDPPVATGQNVTIKACSDDLTQVRHVQGPDLGVTLSVRPDALAQRIHYQLPWRPQGYPLVLGRDGTLAPVLSVFSVSPIVSGDGRPFSKEAVYRRVVIIGSSFWESRDLQSTPLGLMPGVLVLINAIHSLEQHGEVALPSLNAKLLITALLILLSSLISTRLRSSGAMVAAALVIIIGLLPLSYYYFKAGVWLDFVIPLCGVMLHWRVTRFEEHRHP